MQQNSFNPAPYNSDILVIQHLRRKFPQPEAVFITSKKLHQWNSQISGTCSKGIQGWLYINRGYLQTLPLPTPSTSSTVTTPENAEEDPDAPEPADEGNIQIEYSSD